MLISTSHFPIADFVLRLYVRPKMACLREILSNALNASRPVDVTLSSTVRIRDYGHGIEPEIITKVLTDFDITAGPRASLGIKSIFVFPTVEFFTIVGSTKRCYRTAVSATASYVYLVTEEPTTEPPGTEFNLPIDAAEIGYDLLATLLIQQHAGHINLNGTSANLNDLHAKPTDFGYIVLRSETSVANEWQLNQFILKAIRRTDITAGVLRSGIAYLVSTPDRQFDNKVRPSIAIFQTNDEAQLTINHENVVEVNPADYLNKCYEALVTYFLRRISAAPLEFILASIPVTTFVNEPYETANALKRLQRIFPNVPDVTIIYEAACLLGSTYVKGVRQHSLTTMEYFNTEIKRIQQELLAGNRGKIIITDHTKPSRFLKPGVLFVSRLKQEYAALLSHPTSLTIEVITAASLTNIAHKAITSLRVRQFDGTKTTTTVVKGDKLLPTLKRALRIPPKQMSKVIEDSYFIPYPLTYVIVNSHLQHLLKTENLSLHNGTDVLFQVLVDQLQYAGLGLLFDPAAVVKKSGIYSHRVFNDLSYFCLFEPLERLITLYNTDRLDLRSENRKIIEAGLVANGYVVTSDILVQPKATPLTAVDNVLSTIIKLNAKAIFLWEYDAAADCGVALISYPGTHHVVRSNARCVGYQPEHAAAVVNPHLRNVANLLHRIKDITPALSEYEQLILSNVMAYLRQKQIVRYTTLLVGRSVQSTLDALYHLFEVNTELRN